LTNTAKVTVPDGVTQKRVVYSGGGFEPLALGLGLRTRCQ
jgi:hypothetical protein